MRQQATSAADGSFSFSNLALATYNLDAVDSAGRIQARTVSLNLASGGTAVNGNLVLVATGTVTGRLLNPDSSTAPNQAISLHSYNAAVGGFYGATTDAQGNYSIVGIPIGSFAASANDAIRRLLAEASGQVTAGGSATANLQFTSNVTALPANRYDANNYLFDLQADGSAASGAEGEYAGAFLLDILSGSSAQRFTGSASANSDQAGRQIVVQQVLAQLNVTRKVFVPRDGYFARYLEILSNPTANPITVGIRISSTLPASTFLQTSSGSSVLNVTSSTDPDRWAVLDDDSDDEFSQPALGFVFDGAGASSRASATTFSGSSAQLSYEWDNIAIGPGATVALLHFALQQPTRTSAQISADHLDQLPPEALAGLSSPDAAAVVNFVIPPGAASFLAPLPGMNGSVSGRVWDWSRTIPIPNAQLEFKSHSAFFGRSKTLTASASANYSLTSLLNDTGTSVAIPLVPFDVTAQIISNSILTANVTVPGSFPVGQGVVTQDIVFSNTGNLSIHQVYPSGPPSGIDPSGGSALGPSSPFFGVGFALDATGSAFLVALRPGQYTVNYILIHPQSNRIQGGQLHVSQTVTVAASQTTAAPSAVPPMGAITGIVTNPDGSPAAGVAVAGGPPGTYRITTADGSGRYTLFDILAGTTSVAAGANFPPLNSSNPQPVTVVANQTVTKNLMILGYATITVQVRNADGTPTVGASVNLENKYGFFGDNFPTRFTDATGTASFPSVIPGSFSVYAAASGTDWLRTSTVSGTIAQPGDTVNVALTLPAAGTVSGRVSRPNGTPAVASPVNLRFSDPALPSPSTTTDSAGNYLLSNIPAGTPFALVTSYSNISLIATVPNQILTGSTLTVNATLPPNATVRVTVQQTNGSPYGNVPVELIDSANVTRFATADASGVAVFLVVRDGTFTVQASMPNQNTVVGETTITVAPTDDGATLNVIVRAGFSGTVQGTVFAGDGTTPVPFAQVDVVDVASGVSSIPCQGEICGSASTDANGTYLVSGVVSGSLGFRITASFDPGTGPVTAQQTGSFTADGQVTTANLTLPLSVVKGTVFLADGATPVGSANVFAQQGENQFFGSSDVTGRYVVVGLGAGTFTITAQDPSSSLTGTATGTVTSVSTPVAMNVLMGPAGSVNGQVQDSAGRGVTGASVGVSSELGFSNTFNIVAGADVQGNYRVDRIPLGAVVVQGQDPATGASAIALGAITSNGQVAALTVGLPATGTVQGVVFGTDGVSRASNADVTIQSLSANGPLGSFQSFTSADGSGNYQSNGAPLGVLRVVAADPNNTPSVGLADGALTSLGSTTINPQLGNAIRLGSAISLGLINLDGADGFRYDLGCFGELIRGGTTDGRLQDAYSGAYEPPSPFPCLVAGAVDLTGRQVTFGPVYAGGLSVMRKVFVPSAGKFARYLEVLTNPAATPVTVDYIVSGFLGSFPNTRIVVAPAASNNTYAITDGNGICCSPALAHVFGGNTARTSVSNATFSAAGSSFSYTWHVTVVPGQTVSLMHFSAQRDPVDSTGAAALAQTLVNLSDPDALTGMAAADRAQVLNFNVP